MYDNIILNVLLYHTECMTLSYIHGLGTGGVPPRQERTMSIPYRLRKNPLREGELRAVFLRSGAQTLPDFLRFAERSCTLTSADVKAVLEARYISSRAAT